jgi:pantoate--beta-alanine ligase
MKRLEVIHTIAEFRAWRASHRGELAFVPTMGALHDGHASLVREARKIADAQKGNVAASIFVNPTQFGPAEDFTKYPRTLEADLAMLAAAGCDVAFVPTAEEMYGARNINAATQTALATIDPGPLGEVLEGAIRPGHFRGVCTVVLKLLNVVTPTKLVMGQKDYQQNAVLKKMIADLNIPTKHIMCPTLREPDGLAMSSRNRYLSSEERPRAKAIYESLTAANAAFLAGERDGKKLSSLMKSGIESRGLSVQYAGPFDPDTLEPLEHLSNACVFLVAAKLGNTRLIDNLIVGG